MEVLKFSVGNESNLTDSNFKFIQFGCATSIWSFILLFIDCSVFVLNESSPFGLKYEKRKTWVIILFWILGSGCVALLFGRIHILDATILSAVIISATWSALWIAQAKKWMSDKPSESKGGGTTV